MNVLIRPEAEAEIAEAYVYYEAAAEGLGAAFLRAVEACLAAIERSPEQYVVVHQQVRRALLRRFPYAVFYIVEPDQVVVLACFHARRDPKQWQNRV
jgi:plasmid stabilization system protein ParE